MAQEGDHLGVLRDEVGVVEPDRQERLRHAPAVAGGLGGIRHRPQDSVAPLIAGELQDTTPRELEVEPLVSRRTGHAPVRPRGALVLLGGDVEGQPRRRLIPGRARVAESVCGIDERPGGVEVRGEVDRRHIAGGGRALERARDPRVQARTATGRKLVDDRVAHERMGERKAIQNPGRKHEPPALRRFQRRERLRDVDVQRVGEDVGVELRTCDARDGQDLRRTVGQPGEPPADDVPHAWSHPRRRVTLVAEGVDRLPDEERIARGRGAHAARQR